MSLLASPSPDSIRTNLRALKVLQGAPSQKLDFASFPDNPHDAFRTWLQHAIESDVPEPHAMTLSTVDEEGCPDARVLILKDVDQLGWHFALKGDSPKGRQLDGNKKVALTFYWPKLARQVRVRGLAIPQGEGASDIDFNERPLASKISAVASKQSEILNKPGDVTKRIKEVEKIFEESPESIKPNWRLYAVVPYSVEFWQGSQDRAHQRLQYVGDAEGVGWEKNLLWP